MGPRSCAKAPYSMTSETYKMKNVLVISLICQSPVQHNPVGSVESVRHVFVYRYVNKREKAQVKN